MQSVWHYDPEPDGGYGSVFRVAYYFDEHTMTVLPSTDERVIAFINEGGAVGGYSPPEPQPEPGLPPLTARQLRLGLIAAGISLASVEGAISAIQDATDREMAMVEWEYASQFERDHHLIEQIGATLGLSPEQIDAAWMTAIDL